MVGITLFDMENATTHALLLSSRKLKQLNAKWKLNLAQGQENLLHELPLFIS